MHNHNKLPRWWQTPVCYSLLVNAVLLYGLLHLTAHRAMPETRIDIELPALSLPPTMPMKRQATSRPKVMIPLPVPHQVFPPAPIATPPPQAEPPRVIMQQQPVLRPMLRETRLPAAPPSMPGRMIAPPPLPPAAMAMPPAPLPSPSPAMPSDPAPTPIALAPSIPGGGNDNYEPGFDHLSPGPGGRVGSPASGYSPSGIGSGGDGGHGNANSSSGSGQSGQPAGEHGSGGTGTGDGQGNGHGTGTDAGARPGAGTAPPATHMKPRGPSCPATFIKQVKPVYPPAARRDGVEGTVLLLVTLTPQGKVDKVKVKNSSGDIRLDDAAVQAVKESTYSPHREDGEAVASTIKVPVTFSLNDDD